MKILITNYKSGIANLKCLFKYTLLLGALGVFAGTIYAQNNFALLAEKIRRGNAEEKREALRQIRNAETAEASRAAIPALRDSSEIVRATAAFSVIFLPADEAVQVLLPLLNDKNEFVRREVAYALGKVRSPLAVAPLVRVFQKDKIADVKNAAVVALGEIGDAAAIDILTQILARKPKNENEADDFLRRSAARSAGQIAQNIQIGQTKVITPQILSAQPENIESPKFKNLTERFPVFRPVVPILINILQNKAETDDTKREAAFALGAIGDAAAIPILQANLAAADYYLTQISREALQKLSSPAISKPAEPR